MPKRSTDAARPAERDPYKPPKRRRGVPISGDIRECIENAFHEAGGRDYLVWVAQRRPDVFLQLVGKIIPSEARLTVMAGYQAMVIPVEAREAIEAPSDPVALPQAVQESPEEILAPASIPLDDWLMM